MICRDSKIVFCSTDFCRKVRTRGLSCTVKMLGTSPGQWRLMEKLWSWSGMWQNWDSFLWLMLLMQNIYDSVCRSFCRKFVSSCLLLLLLLGCDTFLQVSTQMGKKLLRNFFFFFLQKTSWICDFSNLEMLRLDSNGARQCLYKEFSKFDCIQCQWMITVSLGSSQMFQGLMRVLCLSLWKS